MSEALRLTLLIGGGAALFHGDSLLLGDAFAFVGDLQLIGKLLALARDQ